MLGAIILSVLFAFVGAVIGGAFAPESAFQLNALGGLHVFIGACTGSILGVLYGIAWCLSKMLDQEDRKVSKSTEKAYRVLEEKRNEDR